MTKRAYPGLFFTDERTGEIVATLPDLGFLVTGDTIEEAFLAARETVADCILWGYTPKPSQLEDIEKQAKEGDIVLLVDPAADWIM